MLRTLLLLLGSATLAGLIWHIGPSRILEAVAGLGAGAVLLILLPSILMYLLDAWGWRFTLGRHAAGVGFGRLLAIRTAGEVVNMTTPTAYMGGEPLKAYMLQRYGVPLVEGLASVVTAKTTMTLAQIAFILLGIAIAVVAPPPSFHLPGLAAALSVVLLLIGTLLFVAVQRHGLFTGLLALLRRCRLRIPALEAREEKLRDLDRSIQDFYRRDRRAFLWSCGAFFLGWLAEALEVYAILFFLGPPPTALAAISICAFAVLIKGGTFIIPASIGAQEGGNLLLVMAYGYSEVAGITFALLRRVRELVWIAVGLLCLLALRSAAPPEKAEEPKTL